MTAPAAAARAGLAWAAEVEGEIVAIAVRGGEAPLIAVVTEVGDCWAFGGAGEFVARTPTVVDLPTSVAIHPSSRSVAVTGARGCALWWRLEVIEQCSREWCSAAAFNESGDLAVATGRRVLVLAGASGAGAITGDLPSTVTDVAWMPGGERVAASAYGGVYEFEAGGSAPAVVHPCVGSHLAVAASPNGRWVCSGNQDASVHIWRTADNEELQMTGYREKVSKLAFAPGGQWMANNGAPEVSVWDFAGKGPGGRRPRLLVGHERVADLQWRPGGAAVLATVGSEGSARVWDITGMSAGGERRAKRVLVHEGATAVRWLDNEHLVIVERGGRLGVWSRAAR